MTLALLVHHGGLWSSWCTLVHPGPPGPHLLEKLEKVGSGRIKLDQEDHGDHDPLWWTRSVQDLRGPPSNILLMFLVTHYLPIYQIMLRVLVILILAANLRA